MSKTEILKLVIAIVIGLSIGVVGYKLLKNNPCFDGSAISDTPNYCLR